MISTSDPSHRTSNRSMPPGKIIPELMYDNLDTAVPWLCKAFGFKERLRIANHRSQLVLGEASIIAIEYPAGSTPLSQDPDRSPQYRRKTDHSILVSVDDIDRHFEQAVGCGAIVINPPASYPYGERQYSVEDIGGHVWTFSQSITDVDPAEWGGRMVITE